MNAQSDILSPLGKAAVTYAKRGWHVFPLQPGKKQPMRDFEWKQEASNNPAKVKGWWKRFPDANIALYCAGSGLVVVDVDSYKSECDFPHDLYDTLTQNTPSGGTHHIFRAEHKKQYPGTYGSAVEIKHEGYILLAPSKTVPKDLEKTPNPPLKEYAWQNYDAEIAPAPAGVGERVQRKEEAPDAELLALKRVHTDADRAKVLAMLETAPNELNRDQWISVCNATKWVLDDEGREAFIDWSYRYDGHQREGEPERVWDTARPRGSVGMGTLIHLLGEPRDKRQEPAPDPVAAKTRVDQLLNAIVKDADFEFNVNTDYCIKGWLDADTLGTVYGDSNVGKSFLAIDMSFHIAAGCQWNHCRT
ncbi:MAG: bifunctional DNA primase/polymerase, partial [Pseudomonadota bacterium]